MYNYETIFVSGNPDIYPLEYYDEHNKCFDGIVPEIYKEFSKEYSYRIVYIDHKDVDMRIEDLENSQADIISGISAYDDYVYGDTEEFFNIMTAKIDGEDLSFSIMVTDNASKDFKKDFTEYMNKVYENKDISHLIKEYSIQTQKNNDTLYSYATFYSVFIIIILIVIISSLIKKVAGLKKRAYLDNVTGINNYDYLLKNYTKKISEKERVLYNVIYIEPDTDTIYRMSNRNNVEDYFRHIAFVINNYTNDDNDIVIKLQNENFVIFKMIGNSEEIYNWIEKLITSIESFSSKFNKNYPSRAWAGIYELKNNDNDINEIIKKAKYSCYYAKNNHLSYSKCNMEIYNEFYEKNLLEDRIETGLLKNEFVPYMQFILESKTGKIKGAEIVSRWNHPYRGMIYPDKYIDIMEKNNYIQSLDFKMLEKACEILEKIYKEKPVDNDFFLTCNFSRYTISTEKFINTFNDIINKYSFPRESLLIEVNTARNLTGNTSIENVFSVKDIGVKVIMDDFGIGYMENSQTNFEKYDGYKIDKDIIEYIESENGRVIVNGFLSIFNHLGRISFAEGVDTFEKATILKNIGCNYIQGNYFYYPVPVEEAFNTLNITV